MSGVIILMKILLKCILLYSATQSFRNDLFKQKYIFGRLVDRMPSESRSDSKELLFRKDNRNEDRELVLNGNDEKKIPN